MGSAAGVLTFGETMASMRSTRSIALGDPFTVSVAGAESNVAIGLARLGHPVRWVGRIGDDEFGKLIARTLRAERVDTAGVIVDDTASTGLMFLETPRADFASVHYYRSGSAGSKLRIEDVVEAVPGSGVLHLTGITPALSDTASQAVAGAIEIAHDAGVPVSFDVNYRSKLWSAADASRTLSSLVRSADIVIASAEELALVATAPADDVSRQAAGLLADGVREVVVTRGAAGAQVFTSDAAWAHDAFTVTVADTIGAGDAFAAGYLSALLDGEDPLGRLRRGCLLGAFAVGGRGDWETLPDRHALEHAQFGTDTTLR